MLNRLTNFFYKGTGKKQENDSVIIDDINFISPFLANPDFPWFISFPRTGSHWLRMIMELYFEKPSLARIFYYKEAKDFSCFHRHDSDLSHVGCRNVLYLYRNPVSTIYSQINYDKKDINDTNLIQYWSAMYGKHLSKWLIEETFTKNKTIITYEEMKKDIYGAFSKVCDHFGTPFERSKLNTVLPHVSKSSLKKKTKEDPQIVNLDASYEIKRKAFKEKYSTIIWDLIYAQNDGLRRIFEK